MVRKLFVRFIALSLLLAVLLPAINISLIATDSEDEGDDIQVRDANENLLSCGVERWAVKTCTDADTTHVNFYNIIQSSIAYQRSLPVQPTLPPNNRLLLEDTVYSIDCRLTQYKLEDDGDIHCVIVDANNQSMVSEICDPSCPGIINTSRYGMLSALRTWFVNNYHPTTSWQYPNINIRITGVGFYDFLHGQTGIPPNGREIHPILTMSVLTPVLPGSNQTPLVYKLYQNYPNPFNPSTKISFDLPASNLTLSGAKSLNVRLAVYDITGREVAVLVNEPLASGLHSIEFDASKLTSGIYFYRLDAGGFSESKKMVLVK